MTRDEIDATIKIMEQLKVAGQFREARVAVWNTVMDEDRYLTRRWNEFISA
jgi:hypothetical protein